MKTNDQIAARVFIDAFMEDPNVNTACLQGYAGVGKTWLVGDWLSDIGETENTIIAAPTHKALDVLRQKCGQLPVVFRTLHSLLGIGVRKTEEGDTEQERFSVDHQCTLLVVDEGSMVGQEFFDMIAAKQVSGALRKVLYIGDPAQLPPVKEELSPIFKVERSFTMREIVRYAGPIIKVATFLREHIEAQTQFTLMDVMALTDPADRAVCHINRAALYNWTESAQLKGLDARILAWTNAAVLQHNQTMHARMYPVATTYFAESEKILVADSYTLTKAQGSTAGPKSPPDALMNGEVLTCIECVVAESVSGVAVFTAHCTTAIGKPLMLDFAPNEAHRLNVHKDLNSRIYNMGMGEPARKELVAQRKLINRLAPLRHAYACTVHKSQGSTYDVSIVDFSDIYRSEDKARLMYVAATRPSKYLMFAR
jgi:exodeoxyribonuclease-5